ncbi:MAG: aldo/keto reductase, partial [Clostridia bacterium]|nr:aldo/keto reductase [Clostridia bacterium]
MQYVTLGKTGLCVSRVGFGGIPIQRIEKDEAPALIEALVENGINYIDTAPVYGTG